MRELGVYARDYIPFNIPKLLNIPIKKLKEHVDSEYKMSVGVLQSEGWKH